jgi:signal transduction histidine kinase
VEVTIHAEGERLGLIIKDDGEGFDPAPHFAATFSGEHIGMAGIIERAQALGGSASLDSAPGRGATWRVSLNIGTTERAA